MSYRGRSPQILHEWACHRGHKALGGRAVPLRGSSPSGSHVLLVDVAGRVDSVLRETCCIEATSVLNAAMAEANINIEALSSYIASLNNRLQTPRDGVAALQCETV